MDLLTYAVYGFLMLFSIGVAILGRLGVKGSGDGNQAWIYSTITVFVVAAGFSVISGVRYEVGVDWFGYMVSYENLRVTGFDRSLIERWEFGYSLINRVFASGDFGHQWMFATVAMIGWVIYLSAVQLIMLPALLFFVLAGEVYFWSNNVVRQFVAAAMFVFSIRFIDQKRFFCFLVGIAFGALFHVSVVILLPLYFLVKRLDRMTVFMPWAFLLTFMVGQLGAYRGALSFLEAQAPPILMFLGYQGYVDRVALTLDTSLGIGFYLISFTNFMVLSIGAGIREKDSLFRAYLAVFFIGAVLFNLLYVSQLAGRITIYFLLVKPILLAYIMVYLRNNFEGIGLKLVLVGCSFAIFLAAIHRSSHQCCPYQWAF